MSYEFGPQLNQNEDTTPKPEKFLKENGFEYSSFDVESYNDMKENDVVTVMHEGTRVFATVQEKIDMNHIVVKIEGKMGDTITYGTMPTVSFDTIQR